MLAVSLYAPAAKCSTVWRKRRRCKSNISGTVLLNGQHVCFASMELTHNKGRDFLVLSNNHRNFRSTDDSAVSVECCSSVCVGEEKLAEELTENPSENHVENLAPAIEHKEELLPVSDDHVSSDQLQMLESEFNMQSFRSEDGPSNLFK